jgi:hypothetical protein
MSNLSSTAGTVHATAVGYANRSACGTMQETASKFRTNKPVDCSDCLALPARANAIVEMSNLVEAAHSMDRADRNAQRYYRAARTVDLRRWLSPTYENASPVDPWTKARRTRLMRAELASRDAELCRSHDHYDRFGGANENVASHVAAHRS